MRNRFWIAISKNKIYTKLVGKDEPKLFFQSKGSQNNNAFISLNPFLNENCLVSLRSEYICIIPIRKDFTPGTPQIIAVKEIDSFSDAVTWGNRLIVLTENRIHFFVGKFTQDRVRVRQVQTLGMDEIVEDEFPASIEISTSGRYVMVSKYFEGLIASSLTVYEIKNLTLFKRSFLDVRMTNQRAFYCLRFVEQRSSKLYFSALPGKNGEKILLTYYYDEEKNEIKEVVDLRRDVNLPYIFNFSDKKDGSFVGIEEESRILTIKYE